MGSEGLLQTPQFQLLPQIEIRITGENSRTVRCSPLTFCWKTSDLWLKRLDISGMQVLECSPYLKSRDRLLLLLLTRGSLPPTFGSLYVKCQSGTNLMTQVLFNKWKTWCHQFCLDKNHSYSFLLHEQFSDSWSFLGFQWRPSIRQYQRESLILTHAQTWSQKNVQLHMKTGVFNMEAWCTHLHVNIDLSLEVVVWTRIAEASVDMALDLPPGWFVKLRFS